MYTVIAKIATVGIIIQINYMETLNLATVFMKKKNKTLEFSFSVYRESSTYLWQILT